MPPVTIYTTPTCPYCRYAKNLLTSKGVSFEEIDASNNQIRQAMIERATAGKHRSANLYRFRIILGGCDDLYALDAKGELDTSPSKLSTMEGEAKENGCRMPDKIDFFRVALVRMRSGRDVRENLLKAEPFYFYAARKNNHYDKPQKTRF